jgi:4-amino-4-deoxy-L-arabinose transferase-like glycosyltransferase
MQASHHARRVARAATLPAILAVAAVLRVWSIRAGVPYAVGIDEPAIVDRALRILNTGDWNPHVFDYPTLVVYFHALAAIVLFLGGAVRGAWSSLAEFDITAIYTTARLLTAGIGVLTVWVTYRVGEGIGGRTLGLLAAAQLAVLSMHVRESHFALTDVPVTACTTLAIWLSMQAAHVGSVRSYAAAGVACGLAAAAKYSGVLACVAPAIAWVAHEWTAPDRARKASVAAGCAAGVFLIASPYALLDFPAFLSGFAAHAARVSAPRAAGDAPWLLYLKHLALMGRLWLPLAAAGIAILLWRRSTRTRALPIVGFAAAYFYALATNGIVFARDALPLLPVVCVLAAVPVVEVVRALERIGRPRAAKWALAAGAIALTGFFAPQSVVWDRQFARPDTREVAAAWMKANLPGRARVAVENSGPTYIRTLPFEVVPVELAAGRPLEWYRTQRVEYLVISSGDADRNRPYLDGGPVVFEVDPGSMHWGPPIRIVRLMTP